MEFEQIIKQLEWLDQQQSQTKQTLAKIDERLTSFETTVNAVSKQIKDLDKQMTQVAPAAKRMEQFESLMTKHRSDLINLIDEREKERIKSERESTKQTRTELDEMNALVTKLDSIVNGAEFKKQNKERKDEIQRISNNMTDLKTRVEEVLRSNEDTIHSLKAMDEIRKNDLKRIADVQGEITSLRKRIDEQREKTAVNADGARNIENRLSELLAAEADRRQAQNAFLEQQALAQIDRDRAWKDWKEKYDAFLVEAENMDAQVQSLDETLRGAKKAQEAYLDLNTKLERRISEVSEMQRLTEDRLRQEWVSFKADDQKRWTGYSLSSEESLRDIRKDLQKAEERMTTLGDSAQELQDQMHQTTDTTEKQLQELMNVVHEWMTSYQRIMGHGKKTKK